MRALLEQRLKSAGALLVTTDAVAVGALKRDGWAMNSGGYSHVTNIGASPVPATRQMFQGLAFTPTGALYVTDDAPGAASIHSGGFSIRVDGALHATEVATGSTYAGGVLLSQTGVIYLQPESGFIFAPPTEPDAPTIGTATREVQTATVTFTPPGSDGGSAITLYTVYSSVGGFSATGASSPITITGLAATTAYTFTVKATNAIGEGAASAASNSVTTTQAYFVKNGGSDVADGKSDANAWETVGKVNGATFAAGDGVYFNGGNTFSDAILIPPRSGSAGNVMLYGSYGSGRGILEMGTTLSSWTSEVNSTPTLDAHQDLTDGVRTLGASGFTAGQAFKPTQTATLNSIEFNLLSTPTVNAEVRIGTSSNLTSATETISRNFTTGGSHQWVVFTSATNPSLTSGNTYYIGVTSNDGGPEADIYDGVTQYADGSYYYGNNINWNMSNNVSTRNITFRVNLNVGTATIYYATLAAAPDAVYQDGVAMLKRQAKPNMPVNSWYYDSGNTRLYVRTSGDDDPAGHTIISCGKNYGVNTNGQDYIKVNNLQIQHTFFFGVRIDANSTNVEVSDCLLDKNGFAVNVFGSTAIITRNTLTNGHIVVDDATPDNDYGAVGVQVNGSNVEISYNTITNMFAPSTDYTEDGGAVEIFETGGLSENVSVHHNIIENTSGLVEIGGAGGTVQHVRFYSNLIYEHRSAPDSIINVHNSNGFAVTIDDLVFDNNTIVSTGTNSGIVIDASAAFGAGEFIFRNNIIYASNMTAAANREPSTHTNNCYRNTADTSWAALGFTIGASENKSDPLFVNAASDWHLQAGSPCKDTGMDVSLTTDLDGVSIPQNGTPDMGAYEFH